jgi:uroporphyrinogen III methyltransferase/synthase
LKSPRSNTSVSPLAGRNIVVTRPRDRADEMIEAITRLGGEALIVPMIAVQPLPMAEAHLAALRKLEQFDWLVFTSTSAVEMFHLWLEKAMIKELPATLHVIAVGEKTAAVVRAHGWHVEALAERASADGVVATLLQQKAGDNTKILFPRALEGRELIPQELEKVGAQVVVLPVYQTAPATPKNLAVLRLRLREKNIDAITFTSPSAAQQFFHLLPLGEWPILREICLAAIGRTTAAAIREHGLQASVMPETTSAVALIEAIAKHFQQSIRDERIKNVIP